MHLRSNGHHLATRHAHRALLTAISPLVATIALLVGLAGPGEASTPVRIATIAGGGSGINLDDLAVHATLNWSAGIGYDSKGNLYIAETWGYRILKVDTTGHISTVVHLPAFNPAVGASGIPGSLAFDSQDHLYVVLPVDGLVVRVEPNAALTIVAGGGQSTADSTTALNKKLDLPGGIAFGPGDVMYLTEWNGNRVHEVSAGMITKVAGTGVGGYNGDGIPATSAQLDEPSDVAVDATGAVVVTETAGNRVRRFTVGGDIATVAGTGVPGYSGDNGPAANAMLKGPSAVALDAVGALHVADSSNNRIRKIDSSGTISTEVGTGVAGFSGDGGAPTAARLNRPRDVAFDRFGRLTIDDPYNGRVRQLGTLWALP